MSTIEQEDKQIFKSKYISRDLSWLKFNDRVLEQAKSSERTILERLKFVAITASNLDEFMMIRVGSLFNYLDYDRERVDYCGLKEWPFKNRLYREVHKFVEEQNKYVEEELVPQFSSSGFLVVKPEELDAKEVRKIDNYFNKTIYPMLTPMVFDTFHTFPALVNKVLTLGVVTKTSKKKGGVVYSFVQIPTNLPRFFEIERGDKILFVPIEEIIERNIHKLYKNVDVSSVSLFRITRNGDFDYDDYDESDVDFVEEIQKKLKKRRTGRVVRLEVRQNASKKILNLLNKKFQLEEDDVFESSFLDFTAYWQVIKNSSLASKYLPKLPSPVRPLNAPKNFERNIFEYLKHNDLVLHHPFHSMDPLLLLLEQAANDSKVLAIKVTIYRLAKDSRIIDALLRAAENGVHVSVLFEVKARFDEENNIRQGQRLQKAGCYVVYGISRVKTHTKLLQVVRRERNKVTNYVHMSSGNYNEDTARLYTDLGYLTSKAEYGRDVAEFFNVITGHSQPSRYRKLITTPGDMRKKLISLIRAEVRNKKAGQSAGIVLKANSLEDSAVIDELYKASRAGVEVKLIVRGICCLRPGRKRMSENIFVKSIVGDYLEHSRIYYFHNNGDPKVYGGSADIMVRSFDKRIESLFLVDGQFERQQFISILDYNLKDEKNSFVLQEDGSYLPVQVEEGQKPFDLHKEFFNLTEEKVKEACLFAE